LDGKKDTVVKKVVVLDAETREALMFKILLAALAVIGIYVPSALTHLGVTVIAELNVLKVRLNRHVTPSADGVTVTTATYSVSDLRLS